MFLIFFAQTFNLSISLSRVHQGLLKRGNVRIMLFSDLFFGITHTYTDIDFSTTLRSFGILQVSCTISKETTTYFCPSPSLNMDTWQG